MSTSQSHNAYWLNALALTLGTSPRLRSLLSQFESPENLWIQLNQNPSLLSDKTRDAFLSRLSQIDPEEEWNKLDRENIRVVTYEDSEYPAQLKTIHSPPLLLYVKGNIEVLSWPSVAVVGTRSHSSYGKDVVERIIPHLSRAGLCIVSGLAQGIDSLSHSETLRNDGKTVAVLGCGIDAIDSTSSNKLSRQIVSSDGALVSEYPLKTPPLKQNFPARNRIIAGLCLGTLVVESRLPGGSLITAQHAIDEGREVFAVPGPITGAASEGTNKLIQDGAHAVTSAEDILDILNLPSHTSLRTSLFIELSQTEQKIMDALEVESLYIDDIIERTALAVQEANARLTALELKGLVKHIGGNTYQRLR